MSGLSHRLATLAERAGLLGTADERAERGRRLRLGWRWPFDDALLRSLDRLAFEQRRPAAGGPAGEHRSRARAGSTDFVDHRPYLPGDDFRQIDWNAYGRLNQLHVRLTEARERQPLHLLLDCSASMAAGEPTKFDAARQLAGALGYVALARYDSVSVVPLGGPGRHSRPLVGKQRFQELLELFDSLEPSGRLESASLFSAGRAGAISGQAVLISDLLLVDGYEGLLERLERAGLAPSVIQVLSAEELEPALDGDLELVDRETGEVVQVGLTGPVRQTYQQRLADWCDGLERHCSSRGFPFHRALSHEPVEDTLLVALREARLLR